ncbi:hypothetical protein DFH06DRAFT_1165334 [Mycena polygramma]|nr:hypothetical protein DFH06DRAFT_1165334 [Mycena polygramma]
MHIIYRTIHNSFPPRLLLQVVVVVASQTAQSVLILAPASPALSRFWCQWDDGMGPCKKPNERIGMHRRNRRLQGEYDTVNGGIDGGMGSA